MTSDALHRELPGGLVLSTTSEEHVERLEALQRVVFPTLAEDELLRANQYRKHLELFAEGQFVVVDGEDVVGMTSTLRLPFDPEHPDHTFAEACAEGWFTTHDPEGQWLYGADIGVRPDYRGKGLARALYAARHETVRRLGLKGQLTVGMLSGYGAVSHDMTADGYYQQLLSGERNDPTISAQRKIGFEPHGLVAEYVNDPVCANYGVLLILSAETDVPWP